MRDLHTDIHLKKCTSLWILPMNTYYTLHLVKVSLSNYQNEQCYQQENHENKICVLLSFNDKRTQLLNNLTISVIKGSSGLGSAIKSWILVSTVDTFRHGFQAP